VHLLEGINSLLELNVVGGELGLWLRRQQMSNLAATRVLCGDPGEDVADG
jgi:hypothetical protein